MATLTNMNECDTLRPLCTFLDPYDIILQQKKKKKKMNVHLPVISIVGEIHEHSEVGQMIANAFRMVIGYHLCLTSFTRPTPKALKTELDMEKGFKITYLIGNSLPLHLKRVQFILLIALK